MQKKLNFAAIFSLTTLLIMASLLIASCGQNPSANQNHTAMSRSVATKTPIATVIPTATTVPQATATPTVQVKSVTVSWNGSPLTMYTLNWTNVRSGPATNEVIVKSAAPATAVTVYGSAAGETFGAGTTWYRVSNQDSAPQYIYSAMVSDHKPAPAAPTAPAGTGKVIKINLTTQHAYAYENGNLMHDNLITSGRPELLTPTGTFKIFFKETNATFHPDPAWKGTPLDYAPEHINYALEFYDTGIFIHDATWRAAGDFGPGTQVPHTAPDGTAATGSHGCINTTLSDAAWYYNWAPIGTVVIVSY